MPALIDSLSSLADRLESITHLSHANYRPAGPYTHAILNTPSVLHLIRDAEPAEARLFKFIGEEHGGNKKVEKRDGVVTPLKEMKGGASRGEQVHGGRNGDQVGVMLKTALRLVDDYRPMPRARAHIQALLDSHQAQLERVAELEQLISDATNGTTTRTKSSAEPAASASSTASQRTPDDSIRAEEASLKRLEAYLAQHRKAASDDTFSESTAIPPQGSSFPASSTTMSTPARPRARSRSDSASDSRSRSPSPLRRTAQTPAKTPNNIHIANSLVNGMTPRRAVVAQQTLNRFSPLKLLGTPRAPVGKSGLRDEDEGPRPIFSRASILKSSTSSGMGRGMMTPASRGVFGSSTPATARRDAPQPGEIEGSHELEAPEDTDDTVKFGRLPPAEPEPDADADADADAGAADVTAVYQHSSPRKPVQQAPTGSETVSQPGEAVPAQSNAPVELEPEVETGPRKVEGVEVDSDQVKRSTDKVWATMPDVMRQGLKDGSEAAAQGVEGTVKHLQMLARSDPPAPPSPSNASSLSSLSSTAPPKAPPITQQTILLAHLLLLLLRSPDGTVSVQAIKETLGSTARARGWEGGEDMATKIIYTAVGKRVVKIDRRGGSGGKVAFNL